MRLQQVTDGRQHPSDLTPNDHHSAPVSVDFQNTSQSLPPGTTYNLDIAVGRSDFQFARVMLRGPRVAPRMGNWKECAELLVTRDSSEAVGHSIRNASPKKVYSITYSKQNSDTNLSHKIFNSGTQNYIAVRDAVLTGSNLRITFVNYFGGSSTLYVQGQALLW
jgi:hypothetical protein